MNSEPRKLCILVFEHRRQLWESQIYKVVEHEQEEFMHLNQLYRDFEEGYPRFTFEPVKCAGEDMLFVGKHCDEVHVAINCKASGKTLGLIEHEIFTLTGLRGLGHHIQRIEFMGVPSSQLHKFLEKRF